MPSRPCRRARGPLQLRPGRPCKATGDATLPPSWQSDDSCTQMACATAWTIRCPSTADARQTSCSPAGASPSSSMAASGTAAPSTARFPPPTRLLADQDHRKPGARRRHQCPAVSGGVDCPAVLGTRASARCRDSDRAAAPAVPRELGTRPSGARRQSQRRRLIARRHRGATGEAIPDPVSRQSATHRALVHMGLEVGRLRRPRNGPSHWTARFDPAEHHCCCMATMLCGSTTPSLTLSVTRAGMLAGSGALSGRRWLSARRGRRWGSERRTSRRRTPHLALENSIDQALLGQRLIALDRGRRADR